MPEFTGTYGRVLAEKVGERPSAFDWIESGKHTAIRARTSTQDAASEINDALAELSTLGGGALNMVEGDYMIGSSIIGRDNVAIIAPGGSPNYGQYPASTSKMVRILPLSGFAADTPLLDFKECRNTYLRNVGVIGDGGTSPNTTATTIGLRLGNLSGETGYARHFMENCSFVGHKTGVTARLADYLFWLFNNIGDNWYCNVHFDYYAGNDGTYLGNYINGSNYVLSGVADPLDMFPGVGLYLGYGCAYQKWVATKVEWNRIGVVLDEGAWGHKFIGADFDNNAAWHVLAVSHTDPADLATFNDRFNGCTFNGGSWPATALGANDGHIRIVGQKSSFYPNAVGLSFNDCKFMAAVEGSPLGENPNSPFVETDVGSPDYPNLRPSSIKYPSTNAISAVVTGSGAGKPRLRLQITDCDFHGASQIAGTCNTSGVTLTRLSGPSFTVDLIGKSITIFNFNPYYVLDVPTADTITLHDSAGTLSNVPWTVDTNQIVIDADYSGLSEVVVSGCVGVTNYIRPSSASNQRQFEYRDSAGAVQSYLQKNGDVRLGATLRTDGLVLKRDAGGVLYVERYDGSYLGSVLDFASEDGLNNPTFASMRLANSERLRLMSDGARTTGRHEAIGGPVIIKGPVGDECSFDIQKDAALGASNILFRISHRANGQDLILYSFDGGTTYHNWLKCDYALLKVILEGVGLRLTAEATARPARFSSGGDLSGGKIALTDANDVAGASLTTNAPLIWDGTKVASMGALTASKNVVTDASGVLAVQTLTAAAPMWTDGAGLPGTTNASSIVSYLASALETAGFVTTTAMATYTYSKAESDLAYTPAATFGSHTHTTDSHTHGGVTAGTDTSGTGGGGSTSTP